MNLMLNIDDIEAIIFVFLFAALPELSVECPCLPLHAVYCTFSFTLQTVFCTFSSMLHALDCTLSSTKTSYSSRPGSAWASTHVRLIFVNDSFIKCVSSILKYWRNCLITEENDWINKPHSVVHPCLYCWLPWLYPACTGVHIWGVSSTSF